MDNLYDKIERLAKERGFENVTVLCKAVGVPRAVMSELKAGRTTVLSAKNLGKIASFFGVSMDYLLDTNTESTDSDTEMNEKNVMEFFARLYEPSTERMQNITVDDFTYAMFNEGQNLTEEDKSLLLQMARQLSDKNKKSGQTD